MDAATIGLRLASSAVTPLVKSLFHREEPGAGLVDRPVRISSLLSFGGEREQRRTLDEKRLRTLTVELVDRAARARGPHEAPGAEVRREVAVALTRSLAALGELSMDDVQAVALGADGLARRVRRPGGLSAEADSLYEPLLRIVCLHILNHFTRRSTFVARSLVEQTRRCESIVARLDTLAARVPSQPMADAAFEDRYRRYIVNEHDRLMIHGIDADSSWPLDDAYLSLETTTAAETRAPQERDLSATSLPPTPRRAEDALSGQPRVLLRGNAGSGKTTLLQWLAVTAARQRMDGDGPIQAQLLGLVPFVLPLRRLTRHDRELPPPSALPARTSPEPDRDRPAVPALLKAAASASQRSGRWLSTFTTLPFGSRTKKRRTPHSSSRRSRTISAPEARTAAWTASTSSTSTEMSAGVGAVGSSVPKVICAVGLDGEAMVMTQPRSMTCSRPSRS